MSVNRVEARLVGACEAFRQTDRTRLNEMRAVKIPVCDTPKASSANAERIEQASQKVEKQSRTSRSWFEGISVERVCKVMPDTVRNCAWQISRRLARPGRMKHVERSCGRARNGQVPEFTEMSHFREPQKAGECNRNLWRGTVMVSSGHWRGTLSRVRRGRHDRALLIFAGQTPRCNQAQRSLLPYQEARSLSRCTLRHVPPACQTTITDADQQQCPTVVLRSTNVTKNECVHALALAGRTTICIPSKIWKISQ